MEQGTVEKLKRLAVTVLAIGLIALNKKLGLGLESAELMSIAVTTVGYVATGAYKATALAKAEREKEVRMAEVVALPEATQILKDAAGILERK